MKNVIIKLMLMVLTSMLIACKSETTKIERSEKDESEISTKDDLEQAPLLLKNKNGEQIKITFFAKDDEIAIKLLIKDELSTLESKGLNDKGNPIFSDQNYLWELFADMKSGQLTDREGNISLYFLAEE